MKKVNNTVVSTVLYVDTSTRQAVVTNSQGKKQPIRLGEGVGIDGEGLSLTPPSGRQWKCIVDYSLGEPFISKFLNQGSMYAGEERVNNSTESGGKTQDPFFSIFGDKKTYRSYIVKDNDKRQNFRSNQPTDSIPGELFFRTLEGNMLGILRGGVNVMGVSPLNQILQFLEDDLLRILARNMEIMTDFGVISITNDDGKTLLSIKGNSGINDKFDTREETYEFELQIGAVNKVKDGTFILFLEINTGDNQKLILSIDREGSVQFFGPKEMYTDIGTNYGLIAGNQIGAFAGKKLILDAGEEVEMSAGATVSADPDTGEVVTQQYGMTWRMDSGKIHFGDKSKDGDSDYQLVTKKHLDDHFNKLLNLIADIILAPCTGDLGLPLPLAIRTGKLDALTQLYGTLQSQAHTLNTTAT